MWNTRKRLNRPDRTSSLENPTSPESLGEGKSHSGSIGPNDGNHNNSNDVRPVFRRGGTDDTVKDLPALPSNALEVPAPTHERPISDVPSSIYSQPSPELQSSYMPQRLNIPKKTSTYTNDVSPPESLRRHDGAQDQSSKSSFEVSPITDSSSPVTDRLPPSGKYSSIPIMKKSQKFGAAGNMWSNWRARGVENKSPDDSSTSKSKTRWDDYSGERTTSEKGKPGQVTPGSVPFDPKYRTTPTPPMLGNTTTISAGTGVPKRKKVPVRDENYSPPVREEWKGASGRYKIMAPLPDKPLPPGKKAVFPAGSHKMSESPEGHSHSRDAISPTSGLGLSPISDEPTPTKYTFSRPLIEVNESEPNTPTAALPTAPAREVSPPAFPPTAESESPRLSPDDTRSPLARHPSTDEMRSKPVESQPDGTADKPQEPRDTEISESAFRADLQHLNLEDQPPSRFSATTYATTNDSPPETPETTHEPPPMPTPPPSSILHRKRPVPVAGVPSNKPVSRKEGSTSHSQSASLSYRNSKSLPKSPPEMTAQTRVAGLEAKLDNLRRRKTNIQVVLHELTNVVQPSSIAYDIAARKEVKRTVEGLEREMAEVLKEEHETGLKLHRAWKRQDENSVYEPTGLWVRRVTT